MLSLLWGKSQTKYKTDVKCTENLGLEDGSS